MPQNVAMRKHGGIHSGDFVTKNDPSTFTKGIYSGGDDLGVIMGSRGQKSISWRDAATSYATGEYVNPRGIVTTAPAARERAVVDSGIWYSQGRPSFTEPGRYQSPEFGGSGRHQGTPLREDNYTMPGVSSPGYTAAELKSIAIREAREEEQYRFRVDYLSQFLNLAPFGVQLGLAEKARQYFR